MRISGITIACNAVENGYPVAESLRSLLPLCDEVVVNIGASTDGTREVVAGLGSPKIRLLEEPWDMDLRERGLLLSRETNRALDACTGDWVIYLQADEVLHEDDRALLLEDIGRAARAGRDGVSLAYLHFYGSPRWIQDNPFRWYRRAVRAVRRDAAIRSVGDALKFRKATARGGTRRLAAIRSAATVYHYGWARPPEVMLKKQRHLDRFWHSDEAVAKAWDGVGAEEVYRDTADLVPFRGSHPAVMAQAVAAAAWPFDPGHDGTTPRWWRMACSLARRAVTRRPR